MNQFTNETAINTQPLAELACPDWCTDCTGLDDGGLLEHTRKLDLGIGIDGEDGEIHVNQVIRLDADAWTLSTESTTAFLGNGNDAQLTADQCRTIALQLIEAADLMDSIDAKNAA